MKLLTINYNLHYICFAFEIGIIFNGLKACADARFMTQRRIFASKSIKKKQQTKETK